MQRKTARRRALPIFVWVASGAVAAVTAVAVLPGLLDSTEGGLRIDDPASAPAIVAGEPTPAPGIQRPSHYVAVSGSKLVLRSTDPRDETVLAEMATEGESQIVALAVRPVRLPPSSRSPT